MPKRDEMEFKRCPYDASPIEPEPISGGGTLLSCPTCGAAWEWQRTWLRRVREPNRDAVCKARTDIDLVDIVRDGPEPAFVAAMWRHVRTSLAGPPRRRRP